MAIMEVQNPQHLPFELTKEFLNEIQALIEQDSKEELIAKIEDLFPADITSILYELNGQESKYLVQLLEVKVAAEIISDLDSDDRIKFLKNFTSQEIAVYINEIDSDDAVDILNEQPVRIREEVIALLKDRVQARYIIDLMHYDEDCAGGLMQKELIKINVKQTVTECVEEIRRQAEEVEKVYSVYVVDDDGQLLGTVSLKKIILAKRGSKIQDVFDSDEIVSVPTYMSGEEVADIMQKYDLEAIPVVNIQGRLLGRITIDDVVDFITESAQEDIQVMAATATLVAHNNVSPALISLLLGASYDILKSYSRLQKTGEFPSGTGLDFPLDVDAEIYLKDGPSFLHRHLPFWTAVWAGRFVKIVIPLLVILIPLFTYIPTAKNFLLRLKLAQVYEELKVIEKNAQNPALKEKNFKDLEAIEKRVGNIKVSMLDAKELYDLKGHVGEVRGRLNLVH